MDSHAKYIGRVGALAVALGVGMAVATTPGVAWATPDAENNTNDASDTPASPDTAGTTNATNTASVSTPPSSTVSGTTTDTQLATPPTGATTTTRSMTETTQTISGAPEVVFRSSGGALTSGDDSSALTADEAAPPAVTVPIAATEAPSAPAPTSPPAPSSAPVAAPESAAAQNSSSPPPAATTPRTNDGDPAFLAASVDSPPGDTTVLRMSAVDADQATPQSDDAQMAAFSALAPAPLPAPANPIAALLAAPVTLINATADFFNAALVSFLTPAPGAPADSPLLWAVLGWVRRQFFNETPAITHTVGAPDALGNIKITLNQTDEDGDALTYTATNGTQGTVIVNPDGHSLTYDPNQGATGNDTFAVTATDANSDLHIHGLPGLINALSFGLLGDAGHTTTVSITVPTNSPPVANNDSATVLEGGTTTIALTGNDTDTNLDPASVQITQPSTSGSLTVNADGTVTYIHNGAEVLSDSFQYTVKDTQGAISNPATVNVTITPVNDAPVASDDSAMVFEGGTVSFFVAVDDADAENRLDHTSVTITQQPTHGTLTVDADGSVNYVHNGDEDATDTFKYTVNDLDGATSNEATVTVTAFPVDDAPVAVADVATVGEGGTQTIAVTANDVDAEDNLDLASVIITQQPTSGTLIVNANGTVTYNSNGAEVLSDSFTYTVEDTDGKISNPATVSITITPVNDIPVKTGEPTASTPAIANPEVSGQVFAGDAEGDDLTYSATAGNGTVTISSSGFFTYNPSAAARNAARTTSTDTVTVTITDGNGGTLTIPVTVTVVPSTNAAPVFNAQAVNLPDPISGEVSGGATAVDPDGDDITYSATAGKGEVEINEDTGTFVYTPSDAARKIAGKPGSAGNDLRDTVTVTATDEYGATSTTNLSVDVAPAQKAVVDTITLTSSPSRLIAGPNNTFYALQGDSVVQINTVTGAVVRTVALGFTPSDIAIGSNGTIFASDLANNVVKRFPASGTSGEIGPFLQPSVLLIGPDGNELFVANHEVATVSVVDGTTGSATAPPAQSQSTFLQITDMVVTPDGKYLLGVMVDKRIVVVTFATDDASPIATGINDPSSAKLAVSLGGKVYVVDPTNDYLAVFTKGGVGYSPVDIPSPGAPSDVAVSSDTSRVYVVNKLAGHVSVYDGSTNALVTTIPIGGSPDELEIDPTDTYLYVSDSTTKKVSVVRLAPTSTSV